MSTLLVTVRSSTESDTVRDSGVEVLATYPDTLLVSATADQATLLAQQGIEAVPLDQQTVNLGGASFTFGDAVHAQEAVPIDPPAGRTAYYLVKLAGPPAPEWLDAVRGIGATIHSSLADFTLLIGALPERIDALRANPWVQDVTPYRPAMKVSAKLRTGNARVMDIDALSDVTAGDFALPGQELVEVSVFPGESTTAVATLVRNSGGTVLSTQRSALVVNASAATLAGLANVQGIQAILPHALPELHNDRATPVMGIPADHVFTGRSLTGAGQIVGIADTGLDSGDPATLHPDVHGRVAGIASWPMPAAFAPYVTNPPGSDDGPADTHSGHGTHVTGSVLGNGAMALAAGVKPAPAGAAPQAQVFFQAVEQAVTWKTAAQLAAEGLAPPFQLWPPAAAGLYGLPDNLNDLFQQAYTAGARVHTNSWGARVAGVYNQNAREVDEFMWANPDMLILFSAGNEGVDTDANGVIDLDSIGSPGTAKNCVTVGASENARPAGSQPKPGRDGNWDQLGNPRRWPALHAAGHISDDVDGMAAFSSRGPTDDGRVKPDVVAPGTNILSTLSSVFPANETPLWGRVADDVRLQPGYCWSGGTSMSTPLVAGAVALIRQYLVDERRHTDPSAALMKAVLVGGARALPGQFPGEVPAGPNPVTGFGRVDAAQAVSPGGANGPLFADDPDDAVATGQIRTYVLHDVDPGSTLTVTLAWTDAPSPAGIGGLENALYLQVRDPAGQLTDGDVTAFPTATNNVQQIVIDTPAAGNWLLRVRGVSVTQHAPGVPRSANPRQCFAVVASNGTELTLG